MDNNVVIPVENKLSPLDADIGRVYEKSMDIMRTLMQSNVNHEAVKRTISSLQEERVRIRSETSKKNHSLMDQFLGLSTILGTTAKHILEREDRRKEIVKEEMIADALFEAFEMGDVEMKEEERETREVKKEVIDEPSGHPNREEFFLASDVEDGRNEGMMTDSRSSPLPEGARKGQSSSDNMKIEMRQQKQCRNKKTGEMKSTAAVKQIKKSNRSNPSGESKKDDKRKAPLVAMLENLLSSGNVGNEFRGSMQNARKFVEDGLKKKE